MERGSREEVPFFATLHAGRGNGMSLIQKGGYVFSVDIGRTEEYYRTHALCTCGCCRNYYAQAKEMLPELAAFLREFGADIARPDEVWSIERGGSVVYLSADYTICGTVEVMGVEDIELDGGRRRVAVTDGFVSPSEQTGPYFTLSLATELTLPWVLDEPFPRQSAEDALPKPKGIWKLFQK